MITNEVNEVSINGGKRLHGEVIINGFKHSVTPMIVSSLLTEEKVIIDNVPRIKDVYVLSELLNILGGKAELNDHTLTLQMYDVSNIDLPCDLVSSIRSSIYILPALVSVFGKAKMPRSGGCKIGTRPVISIANVLRKMGVKVKFRKKIEAYGSKLTGAEINLKDYPLHFVSSATKTAIITGVLAEGKTIINHAYNGPEIVDYIRFLKNMGAKIHGDGTNKIIIEGVDELHGTKYKILPDFFEMLTFIGATAITCGDVKLRNTSTEYFKDDLDRFTEMGVKFEKKSNELRVSCDHRTVVPKINVESYSTDAQPIFAAVLSRSNGFSTISDNVWKKRFNYMNQLKKMGADMSLYGNRLNIRGVDNLHGTRVKATDLRSSAALILAGLSAEGETIISGVSHLDRGYENFSDKLKTLGANIKFLESNLYS